jgi:hypothetical protein
MAEVDRFANVEDVVVGKGERVVNVEWIGVVTVRNLKRNVVQTLGSECRKQVDPQLSDYTCRAQRINTSATSVGGDTPCRRRTCPVEDRHISERTCKICLLLIEREIYQFMIKWVDWIRVDPQSVVRGEDRVVRSPSSIGQKAESCDQRCALASMGETDRIRDVAGLK